MRHDPAGTSVVIMPRSLKLYGMANAVENLVSQGAPVFEAATPLKQLACRPLSTSDARFVSSRLSNW
jgi:hypothetical protein